MTYFWNCEYSLHPEGRCSNCEHEGKEHIKYTEHVKNADLLYEYCKHNDCKCSEFKT